EAHELEASRRKQRFALVVDGVHVQPWDCPLSCPGFGPGDQLRADPAAAKLRMHAGLVGDVRNLAVADRLAVAHNRSVADRKPDVGLETIEPLGPPLPQPPAHGLTFEWLVLPEVGPVARRDERGDRGRVVQCRWAKRYVCQSGWPDSHRRLMRPNPGTL